ncbi:hypothetical protein LSAT2_023648 [Lamellibrachia satsuma]|nr:hypothetical protein LSAT2_023648 [Lamellibrachia satsuma]
MLHKPGVSSRPAKCIASVQLREPIDGLENALLRTIAEQKIEQTRMTKIHSVTGALDWIGPKSELPHGHKANEGRTHSSRATCKSAATRHRQHLDILAASNEDCPTSGDARHTRSTLLRQRKAREAASPEGNVRLCQEKKMRDHMSKDENKQSILTYWVSQPKAQDTFLLATNINRGNRLDTGSIVSSSYSGMLPEVDKDKQFSERVKRMNIVGCVDVKGVWAKLRSITRLCSADNFSVSSTPLRAGGNTFDDSPTTSRTNDVDKGDVNKVSFSRDRQMDVVDDICKYIKHKVKRQKFLTGIPSITIEDKRETSTSESSSSEYQTSDISQTSTPFSTDKAKPDEGAINITTELIDSLITDSPSDVQDEQDKDSVFIREVSSADRVDYLAYLQRAGFAQLNVKMTGKAMKLCPSRSQNQPTDLQGANIRHVPDVNTVSPNSFTDITIVTEPDETAFPSEQPTDVFVVDETVIGPQTDDPSERSKTPEKRPSAPLGRRRNSFEESLVQSNRPAAERRHEQRVMTQLEANAEQALASDSSWRLVDEDAEEDDESFIKDYTGSVVSVGDVNDKERVAPTAMLPTENLLSRRSDTEGTI